MWCPVHVLSQVIVSRWFIPYPYLLFTMWQEWILTYTLVSAGESIMLFTRKTASIPAVIRSYLCWNWNVLCNLSVYVWAGHTVCYHSPCHHKSCLNMSALHLSSSALTGSSAGTLWMCDESQAYLLYCAPESCSWRSTLLVSGSLRCNWINGS